MKKKSIWLKWGAALLGGGTLFQCFPIGGCLQALNPCGGGGLPDLDLGGFWKGMMYGWTDSCWLNTALNVLNEELFG